MKYIAIGRVATSLLAALVLAACGSDNDSGPSTRSSSFSASVDSSSSSEQSSDAGSDSSSEKFSSSSDASSSTAISSSASESSASSSSAPNTDFYRGVDLSYVNEMEDCGAIYSEGGVEKDPYLIFSERGANLVRLRLWHTPDWSTANPEEEINTYSTVSDVKVAIARARAQGMEVLLDFHYSDTWADPGRQNIPAAWSDLVDDTEGLSEAVYDYTYDTLSELDDEGLMPEMVQVGNETNGSMMKTPGDDLFPIDWERNSALLNAGIEAVRDAGANSTIQPKIMLHIAEPENIEWWFGEATENGVADFDVIGISYYTAWSDYSNAEVGELVERLVADFGREVIIVETGVSWSEDGIDDGADIQMRPPGASESSPQAQAEWLLDMTHEVYHHGGSGVVYWEPAWVSTDCYNQWDQGSHWEANTFFDFEGNVIEEGGIRFLSEDYQGPEQNVEATFEVDMSAQEDISSAYITGDFTDEGNLIEMESLGDGLYRYTASLPAHSFGRYHFLSGNSAESRESVPDSCSGLNHSDRHFHLSEAENHYQYPFGACEEEPMAEITFRVDMTGVEGASDSAFVTGDFPGESNWSILPMEADGGNVFSLTLEMPLGSSGAYYFLSGNDWGDRETVPAECAEVYDSDRRFDAPEQTDSSLVLGAPFGSCESL